MSETKSFVLVIRNDPGGIKKLRNYFMTNIIKLSIFTGIVAIVFAMGAVVSISMIPESIAGSMFAPSFVEAYSVDDGYGNDGCCGSDDRDDNDRDEEGQQSDPPPTTPVCHSFTASKSAVPAGGATVGFTWNTSYANAIDLHGPQGRI